MYDKEADSQDFPEPVSEGPFHQSITQHIEEVFTERGVSPLTCHTVSNIARAIDQPQKELGVISSQLCVCMRMGASY